MPEFGGDRMWGLKELPLPEAVSWFPATAGWLAVGAVLLAILGVLVWWRWLAWHRERYRRDALARIDAMLGGDEALVELPLVLRSTALAAFPRAEVAGLRGGAWVAWLNENGGRFDPADAESLDLLPYDPRLASDLAPDVAEHLIAASRAWVKGHHARL